MPNRETTLNSTIDSSQPTHAHNAVWPMQVTPGHIGPVALPGTGRIVWWTGRVAIGLLYQRRRDLEPLAQSESWVQDLMLRHARSSRVGA